FEFIEDRLGNSHDRTGAMHDVVLELLAQAVAERESAGFVLVDGGILPKRAQLINKRETLRTRSLQRAKPAKRRRMRVDQVDGLIFHQLENPVSNQPHNRGFAQDGPPLGDGPLGKLAAERRPAIVDIFNYGFDGVWNINDLERPGQSLRTEPQPVLRGDEMKAANAVARMHRPGMV